jgi:hypothetical protein
MTKLVRDGKSLPSTRRLAVDSDNRTSVVTHKKPRLCAGRRRPNDKDSLGPSDILYWNRRIGDAVLGEKFERASFDASGSHLTL